MSEGEQVGGWPEFVEQWGSCVATVLGQVSGRDFTCRAQLSPEAGAQPADSASAPGKSLVIGLESSLRGSLAIRAEMPSAVLLAQLLLAAPVNPEAEFSQDYENAMAELIRQFAGSFSVKLKSLQGEEIPVHLNQFSLPDWQAVLFATLELSSASCPPIRLALTGDPILATSLKGSKFPRTVPTVPPDPTVIPSGPTPFEAANELQVITPNMDLLRDIHLAARLSFGDRIMPLADVLGCVPGTVVESYRQADMPVELWVEGILAARGDIVIVDGNYGIRVRELCRPEARRSPISRGNLLAAETR